MATSLHHLTSRAGTLASVGDSEGTRAVGSIVALLVALGLAMVMIAVWLYRSTRPDPELLAPLEAMGERRWRRGDPVWQRRRLDHLRPAGANPLEPSVAPPAVDEAFDQGPVASGFDDLHGDAVEPEPLQDVAGDQDPLAPPLGGGPVETETPEAIERPALDGLPLGDIDADAMAAAMAQLDAELRDGRPASE